MSARDVDIGSANVSAGLAVFSPGLAGIPLSDSFPPVFFLSFVPCLFGVLVVYLFVHF